MILSFFLLILSPTPAKAIIVVIPTILIPVVKIVALIIGAISIPVTSIFGLYFKVKNKPAKNGILLGVFALIILAIVIAFILRIENPARPIY